MTATASVLEDYHTNNGTAHGGGVYENGDVLFYIDSRRRFAAAPTIDDSWCLNDASPVVFKRGEKWADGSLNDSGYHHFRVPNSLVNDCYSRSVRFVTDSIDLRTWRLLGSIADHEVVPEF